MPANHAVFEAFWLSGAHAVRASGNVDDGGESVERHGGVGERRTPALELGFSDVVRASPANTHGRQMPARKAMDSMTWRTSEPVKWPPIMQN